MGLWIAYDRLAGDVSVLGAIEQLTVNEVEQNLRFQGQYFGVETELHYNTFRYYDPEIGRS
ncbi:RHS repeat-associated core domain-containing protein [Pseudomonas putida]